MAVKLTHSKEEPDAVLPPLRNGRSNVLFILFDLTSRLFLGTSVAAALAFAYLVMNAFTSPDGQSRMLISSIFFLQSALELYLWHAVVGTSARLLRLSGERLTPFFAEAETGLQKIAALLLALPVVGMLFSAILVYLAHDGIVHIGVTLGYAGFPVNAAWSALSGRDLAMDLPNSVSLPLGSLIIPVVLFCISRAFQYGSCLQQREDQVL
ncbi:MAG: hypothetical protein Q4B91_09110 [Atopobiaceae bacterium]|nr:hypothetical protein [Atopobiaceae bacterium]